MRILFATNKLQSHFAPMLPFARGLKARGHEVRVAALPDLEVEIARHGMGHLVLQDPGEKARAAFDLRARELPRERAGKFFMSQFFMGLLARHSLPGLLQQLSHWPPDLVIRETTEFSSLIAAEKLGLRHVRFEIVNGQSEESIATNYTAEIDALRQQVGLPPSRGGYLRDEMSFSAHPRILDDTPRVNSRAPLRFRAAGQARPDNGTPPDWLPPGDAPLVYITYGTVSAGVDRVRPVYADTLRAVAGLPVRVLLTTGRDAPADMLREVPDNVTVRPFVPQDHVFAHARLMVCHGGSGTVLGGLAAGVPMVVVPMFADQPDNARCLCGAGLGRSVPLEDLHRLGAAISESLADRAGQQRAAAAARDFAALPTVEAALDALLAG